MMIVIGSLAVIVISILIGLVYLRNPKYAYILAGLSVLFIIINTIWSINDPKFEELAKNRIQISEVNLSEQKLAKAYANHYLYTAKVSNNSEYRLTSLSLKLTLNRAINTDATITSEKKIKLHLLPQKSKNIKVYFESDKPSKMLNEKDTWNVEILSIRSK